MSSLDLPWESPVVRLSGMSTITAILETDADGTLHLPVPEEWKAGKVRVVAMLEPVAASMPRSAVPKPDFAAIRRGLWGSDLEKRRLTSEDSAFIRDRGDW